MRRRAFLVTAIAVLVVLAAQPVLGITGGQPDEGRHRNVGAIVVISRLTGEEFQACSGTLIHPRVLLTAGHCTATFEAAQKPLDEMWVNFDEYALNPDTMLDIEGIMTHPDYYWGPSSNPHDVGVLILKEAVGGIDPAQLPEEGFLDQLMLAGRLRQGSDRAKFTVVGYGDTLTWPPPVQHPNDYRRFADAEFQALLPAWLHMSQNQATGNGGICMNDSGGPAFWTEDGTEVVVGINSSVNAVCVAAAFEYRVDIPETLDFIDAVIATLD